MPDWQKSDRQLAVSALFSETTETGKFYRGKLILGDKKYPFAYVQTKARIFLK